MQTTSFQGIGPQFASAQSKRPTFSGTQRPVAPQSIQAKDSLHFSGDSDATDKTEENKRSFMRKCGDAVKQGFKDAVFSKHALKGMGIDFVAGSVAAGVFFLFLHVLSGVLIPITMTLGGLYRFAGGCYSGFKGKQDHHNTPDAGNMA